MTDPNARLREMEEMRAAERGASDRKAGCRDIRWKPEVLRCGEAQPQVFVSTDGSSSLPEERLDVNGLKGRRAAPERWAPPSPSPSKLAKARRRDGRRQS